MVNLLPLGISDMTIFFLVHCNFIVLFCQPRVEVTSCFVYKVMGLTFHDKINTFLFIFEGGSDYIILFMSYCSVTNS